MSVYLYGTVNLKNAQLDGRAMRFKIVAGFRPLGTGLPDPDLVLGRESGGLFRDYKDASLGLVLYVWQATGKKGDGVEMWDLEKVGEDGDHRAKQVGRVKLLKESFRRHDSQGGDQVDTYTIHVAGYDQPDLLRLIIDQPTQVAVSAHLEQFELDFDDDAQEPKKPSRNSRKAEQRDLFETAERLPAGIDERKCPECTDGMLRPGERDGVTLWLCDSCPASEAWVDPLAELAAEELEWTNDEACEAQPTHEGSHDAAADVVDITDASLDVIAEKLVHADIATMGRCCIWLGVLDNQAFGDALLARLQADKRFHVDASEGEGVVITLASTAPAEQTQPAEPDAQPEPAEPNMIERASKARRRK